jgi:hypothetical protein
MSLSDLALGLDGYPSCLKFCHINAESLPGHFDDFKDIFSRIINFDIIGISETWLKPSLVSSNFDLPGYCLLRNDRMGKDRGGVAIYIRSSLSPRHILSSPQPYSNSPEFIFVEASTGNDKILIGIVYRPPKAGRFSILENSLLQIMHHYHHIVLLGDFNCDLLKENFEKRQFITFVESLNLHVVNEVNPTYHLPNSHTLLDLAVVSDKEYVSSHGQIPIPCFSMHDMIFIIYNLAYDSPTETNFTYRSFKQFNISSCLEDAVNLPWHSISTLQDINDKVSVFNDMINCIFDKHAPIRTAHFHRKPAPWINDEILQARRERDKARRVFTRTSDASDFNIFKSLRNRVKSLCRNAKLRFYHEQFNNGNNSVSALWKRVRQLGVHPGKLVKTCLDLPLDDLNDFFSTSLSLSNIGNDTIVSTSERSINQLCHTTTEDPFYFSFIHPSEITHTILSIRKNSKGVDGIPILFYKKLLPVILPTITHIFNFSLQSGVFPDLWKFSIIKPIPKTPNPSAPCDYRPISILCSLSKALERLVHRQVSSHLCRINFFSKFQSGFRPHHSTCTALLRMTDDMRAAMDKRLVTILVQFDFSKAFDNVSHPILLHKLQNQCKFSRSAVAWFNAYLSNRFQAVMGDSGSISSWCPVTNGVPQGSVLGPLLFSIFINNAPMVFSHCSYHMFADDLIIYSHSSLKNIHDTIHKINIDVASLLDWSNDHRLVLNPSKTKSIIVGFSRLLNQLEVGSLPAISIQGEQVQFSTCLRILGVYVDSTLSWKEQTTRICNKVFAGMHQFKRLKRFIPKQIRILLVKSLIMPFFDYCSTVYIDLNSELDMRMQRSLNYAVRYIFDARRDEHITPYFQELGWLKLKDRRRYFLLITVYRIIIKNEGPCYLRDSFTLLSSIYSARGTRSHQFTLQIPHHRTSIFNSSFLISACRHWNSLPDHLVLSPSLPIFRKKLFDYLFTGDN